MSKRPPTPEEREFLRQQGRGAGNALRMVGDLLFGTSKKQKERAQAIMDDVDRRRGVDPEEGKRLLNEPGVIVVEGESEEEP